MAINFPEGTQDLPARVIQVVSDTTDTHQTSLAGDTWHTCPNLSVSITPVSGSSKILLIAQISWWINSGNEMLHRFRRTIGSTDSTIGVGSGTNIQGTSFDSQESGASWKVNTSPLMYLDSPATTSATTYTVQSQCQGPGTGAIVWFNRSYNTTGTDSAAAQSTLTAMEIIQP